MPSDQNQVAAACLDHWHKPGLPEETVSSSSELRCVEASPFLLDRFIGQGRVQIGYSIGPIHPCEGTEH